MTKEEKKLLTDAPYFVIYSKKTNEPYMNEKRMVFLYEAKLQAEAFIKQSGKGKFYIKEDNEEISDIVIEHYYRLGFEKIRIFKPRKAATELEINKNDVKKQFYDPELNRCILLAKQTSTNKMLRSIRKMNVFTPVSITPRQPAQYPNMYYAQAKNNSAVYYFIFSTIEEFNLWKKNNNEFEAMEIQFREINELFKDSIIIINPLSTQLIISQKDIKKALLKEEGK